jgi:membrane fusion protein, heavy metal efflux system
MGNKFVRKRAGDAYATKDARVRNAAAWATAVIALGACSARTGSDQAASMTASGIRLTAAQREHVQLYTVQPSQFHRTLETTGVVDFDNDQATSVLAPFSGPVSRLLVSLGAQVKAETPLAVVDSPDFATAIGAYRKALSIAQTSRRLANLDKDLLEHNGVSQREEAQAETDAVSAEADRDAALQELVSLKVTPQTIKDIQDGRQVTHTEATIRSPIAGTVVERLITPGQLLEAGTTPCFTIADLSRVWVLAQLFGSDLSAVSTGDTAQVVTGFGSNSLSGKVDNISALVDPNTRSVQVRVVVDNPENLLKKQMYVRVLIQARQESTALLIPVSAVLRDDENLPFVYVAQTDGSFARRHITVGYRAGDRYEISAGVQAGDQVVVAGGIFVQFMQSQ